MKDLIEITNNPEIIHKNFFIDNIKKIETVINKIKFTKTNIKFLKWVSDYTLAPIGSVLKLFTINKDIVSYKREDKSLSEPSFKSTILNDEQNNIHYRY